MARTMIGFTGSQVGMSQRQGAVVRNLLNWMSDLSGKVPQLQVIHGCCVGADEDFDRIAKEYGLLRTGRPGPDPTRQAVTDCEVMHPPEPFLARNRKIVADADRLIACPSEYTEQLRSGTWATWRYAQKAGLLRLVIYPDGTWVTRRGSEPL